MKGENTHSSLHQVNVRIWLTELSLRLGRNANLDDIPSTELNYLADSGFEWVWLLGVWQTGAAGRQVSRSMPELLEGYREALPDFGHSDICGSPFAITAYNVHADFGGDGALQRLRERLHRRKMRLLLDFVPNHTAIDHFWVYEHPDFYVPGSDSDLEQRRGSHVAVRANVGRVVLAHGRDPYFAAWPDTLQLNYGSGAVQEAMKRQLGSIANICDGLRCDMAMLITPDVFRRTWGIDVRPFWPDAIGDVRRRFPDFVFMAEVYWGLEWELLQQGFDYAYDKTLYDRLRSRNASAVRDHLGASVSFQRRLVRFLENHDERRAAEVFPLDAHKAAAIITYLTPGMHLFHDGQLDGRTRRASIHLCRRAGEPSDLGIKRFYDGLLLCLPAPVRKDGDWQLLSATPAWPGNSTWTEFVAFAWEVKHSQRILVVVNFAPNQGQCYVRLPFAHLEEKIELRDLMSSAVYERNGQMAKSSGIYFDMPAWGYHVFDVAPVG